jgi:hypothetical protein
MHAGKWSECTNAYTRKGHADHMHGLARILVVGAAAALPRHTIRHRCMSCECGRSACSLGQVQRILSSGFSCISCYACACRDPAHISFIFMQATGTIQQILLEQRMVPATRPAALHACRFEEKACSHGVNTAWIGCHPESRTDISARVSHSLIFEQSVVNPSSQRGKKPP